MRGKDSEEEVERWREGREVREVEEMEGRERREGWRWKGGEQEESRKEEGELCN